VAAQLAAVFSFIALHNYDHVALLAWAEKIDRYVPAQVGKACIPRVWRSITEIMGLRGSTQDKGAGSPRSRSAPVTGAGTNFAALRDFGAYHRRPGLAIVLSDFLTDSDWRAGLRALRASGQEVTAIQILAPEEIQPSLRGDWKLRDVESSTLVEVTISPRLLRRYEEELAAHTTAIRDFCRQQGITFVQLASDVSIPDTALGSLRSAGVLV
jgi:uncharacterized protein (DUF58 family)